MSLPSLRPRTRYDLTAHSERVRVVGRACDSSPTRETEPLGSMLRQCFPVSQHGSQACWCVKPGKNSIFLKKGKTVFSVEIGNFLDLG